MRLNLKTVIVIFLFMFVIACGGGGGGGGDDPSPNPKTSDELPEHFSSSMLGRGYDVFDPYAHPAFVKDKILDLNALYRDNRLENREIQDSDFDEVQGSTYEEYLSNLRITHGFSGSYKFFSGSLDTAFNTSRYSNASYEFATIQVRIDKYAHLIERRTDYDMLRRYLSPDFSRDINNPDVTPNVIFNRYGTHAMVGIVNGARMDYNYSADTSEEIQQHGYPYCCKSRVQCSVRKSSKGFEN